MKMMRRRGFTAIEAAIVIGVSAPVVVPLLIAVSMPNIDRARESARRTSCQSNLKQIGLAALMYAQDYDERYPLVHSNRVKSNVPPYNATYGWADALYPYLRNLQIYQCPSEPHRAGQDAVKTNFVDYWYNGNLSGVSAADISLNPAQVLLHGDGNDGRDLTNARYSQQQLPSPWFTMPGSPLLRHMDGSNHSWLDGHVKWYRLQQIRTLASTAMKPFKSTLRRKSR